MRRDMRALRIGLTPVSGLTIWRAEPAAECGFSRTARSRSFNWLMLPRILKAIE